MDRKDSLVDDAATEAQEYYASVPDEVAQESFRCLDNSTNVSRFMTDVQASSTGNFVVDFSDNTAWAAFDLSANSIKAIFDTERPEALSTRWLNIWYPSNYRSILELLARRYDFSPRLLALMCSDPKVSNVSFSGTRRVVERVREYERSSRSIDVVELGSISDEFSEQSSINSVESVVKGNLYKIASDIWHYTSVDFGRQFVCIGYNSLYGTKRCLDEEDSEGDDAPLPHCTRVWTWVLLCEDNTVISINEDPFPFANGRFTPFQQCVLRDIRRNLVNVFRSLSSVQIDPLAARDPLLLLPIRVRLGQTPEETAHRDSDAPGLLFYYLFETWHNSYTLITRKDSRYGTAMSHLRREMLLQPTLRHIDRLDRLGQELGVLRRHYTSYIRIIDRLLEPITATPASLQNSQIVTQSSQASLNTIRPIVVERASLVGVSLSSAAKMRFKRLRDLIELYALSEVEEYLQQKDAMVSMNFSLIAIKQSTDVDRLTRITLLLTKATILFLPVSLATAYFSTQLVGVSYSVQTYWISFVVVLFLSWLALFLFGAFNGNLQTGEVILGLWTGLQAGVNWIAQRTRRILGSRK